MMPLSQQSRLHMKANLTALFATLAAAGALSLTGCKPGGAEDEAKAPTEVAVQVGKVVRATLRAWVVAYGTVEGEPAGGGKAAGSARLSAPAAGIVMDVPAKEGERVAAGAVIVRLDDRAALAQLRLAEQQMARQNQLKQTGGTSEKAVQEAAQQLASAQAQLALVQLTSPIAGVVARIHVQPGQAVDANTVAAEVIDPARLVATVSVPVAEAASLKAGQPAKLLLERSATVAAQGKVLYISPQVDAKTATVLVRVSVSADSGLRNGQFVHVRIITEERAGKLAVPRESIYTDHDGQSTLSIVEGDVARQKPVKTGLRDGNLVEVEGEGIAEGVTVVTLGSYALPQETKIRILNTTREEAK
jgi:membrane fusion protein (multidrug efflux system)